VNTASWLVAVEHCVKAGQRQDAVHAARAGDQFQRAARGVRALVGLDEDAEADRAEERDRGEIDEHYSLRGQVRPQGVGELGRGHGVDLSGDRDQRRGWSGHVDRELEQLMASCRCRAGGRGGVVYSVHAGH
jgi:hypothetical protein